MRALQLFGDRDLRLTEIDPPPPPAAGEVQVRVRAIGLNYLDVWGFRGMAFAKRKMPQVGRRRGGGRSRGRRRGRESRFKVGDPVVMYGAETCGHCRACREGRDNLCENVAGIMGFHIDGFARELINRPERLVVPVPEGVPFEQAACAPIGFGTVQHMLFDNAKLEPGESILVHAGGSGIGTAAIKMAKAIGCTVFTTVGDDEKGAKARRRSAPTTSSTTAPSASKARSASSRSARASTWCSSMSAPTPGTARCSASSAADGSSPAARPRACPRP